MFAYRNRPTSMITAPRNAPTIGVNTFNTDELRSEKCIGLTSNRGQSSNHKNY